MRNAILISVTVLAITAGQGMAQAPPAPKPSAAKPKEPVDEHLKKLLNLLDQPIKGERFDMHRDPALELRQLLDILERKYSKDGLPLRFDVDTRAFDAEELQDIPKFQVGGKIRDAIEGVSLSTYLRKILELIPVPSGATFVLRRELGTPVHIPGFSEASRPVEPAQYFVLITTRRYPLGFHNGTTAEPKSETRIFPLKNAQAADVTRMLHELFQGTDGKSLRLASDQHRNRVIALGPPEQLDKVAALVIRLDAWVVVPEPKIEIHFHTLKNAQAADVAKTLQALMQEKDGKPIRCVSDQRTNSVIARGHPDHLVAIQALIGRLDEPVEKKADEPKKP